MELLITIFLGVVIAVFGRLIASEIVADAPRFARWLIKQAVLQLPATERDRYREEWLSHLDEYPGTLGKLRHALGCYFRAARKLAAQEGLSPATEQAVERFMFKLVARTITCHTSSISSSAVSTKT